MRRHWSGAPLALLGRSSSCSVTLPGLALLQFVEWDHSKNFMQIRGCSLHDGAAAATPLRCHSVVHAAAAALMMLPELGGTITEYWLVGKTIYAYGNGGVPKTQTTPTVRSHHRRKLPSESRV